MGSTKRKLPVLGNPQEADARPPWQWVGFGVVMILAAWLPLAYLGAAIVAGTEPGGPAAVIAMVAPLVIAAVGGGFLVGRFGGSAGVREALLAGLATGLVAVVLAALSGPLSLVSLVVVAISAASSAAGGALGARGRVA